MSVPRWITRLYNRVFVDRRRRGLQAAADMASPSSFYHDELGRALSEQAFGLTRYEVMKQYSAHEASAVVTLLEGANIRLYLDTRGYRLESGQTYESIEELLQSVSQMYVQKRQDTIITKLQSLQ